MFSAVRSWYALCEDRAASARRSCQHRIFQRWYRTSRDLNTARNVYKKKLFLIWYRLQRRQRFANIIACRQALLYWQTVTRKKRLLGIVKKEWRLKQLSDIMIRWNRALSWRQLKVWSLLYWSRNLQAKTFRAWIRFCQHCRHKVERNRIATEARKEKLKSSCVKAWIRQVNRDWNEYSGEYNRKEMETPRPMLPDLLIDRNEEACVIEELLEKEKRYREGASIVGYIPLEKIQILALNHRIQMMLQESEAVEDRE